MRIGVRGKLFVVSTTLIAVALGVGGVFLESGLRSQLEARIESELLHHALSVAETIRLHPNAYPVTKLDALADQTGKAVSARITIIAAQGRVLGDSELDSQQLRQLEPHGQRPEFLAALARGSGSSRRYSTTLRSYMLYVAVPFPGPAGRGVVRAAKPLSEVDHAVWRLRSALALAGLLALAAAVFLSALASHFFARTLRRVVEEVRALAGKHDRQATAPAVSDEFGGLIGSVQQMAGELQSMVSTLAAERNRFEAVLESMGEGVLALDPDRRITHVNKTALALLGLTESPIGGDLLETIRVPKIQDLLDQVRPETVASREFDLPGGSQPIRLLARATSQMGGGVVLVLHDVTELRRLETVRQDFVANVSHELRTPVSVIMANIETLQTAKVDADQARTFLRALERNAKRLSELIADLLDISRIDSGQYQLQRDSVSVPTLVDECLTLVRPASQEKEISLDTKGSPDQHATADGKALRQVLANLLDNALKYTQAGGQITVGWTAQADLVRVEVQDNGPGIDAKHRHRLFERFYRADSGRAREQGGTGLGLSIAKNLVEAMGGQIGQDPAPEHGSIFWFTLRR